MIMKKEGLRLSNIALRVGPLTIFHKKDVIEGLNL